MLTDGIQSTWDGSQLSLLSTTTKSSGDNLIRGTGFEVLKHIYPLRHLKTAAGTDHLAITAGPE